MLETLEDRYLFASGLSAALVADILPSSTGSSPANYTLGPLVQVSGPSPFAAFQPTFLNAETEPTLAVNPTNPNNVVAAWIQDGAAGIVAGVSFDGGSSWQSVVIPGVTVASGGTTQGALDPWLSFAPNGELYVACTTASGVNPIAFQHARTGPHHIVVNTSSDGGLSWSAPTTLIDDHGPAFTDDKPSITADPTDPNYAYAVWYRGDAASGRHNQTMFACTTDGGQTWEAPRVIDDETADANRKGHQLLVEPNGTLVILVEENVFHGTSTDVFLSSFRSTDRGATWSAPLRGPEMIGQGYSAIDPETGQAIDNGHADYAVGPDNGTLYAVWNDTSFLGAPYDSIAFSMSGDDGLTWSAPVKINQTPTTIPVGNQQAFLPSIAVAADGTVGVTYYDLRNNTPAAGLPTDYWFIHADPNTDLTNPANWSQELRLTDTSFDMETAPLPFGDLFVGDYAGLAAAGDDFVPAWAMPHTNPDGTLDLDSVFSRRIIAGSPLGAAAIGQNGVAAVLTSQQVAALLPEGIPIRQVGSVDTTTPHGTDVRHADRDSSELATPGNQGEQDRRDLRPVLEQEVNHHLGKKHADGAVSLDNLTLGMRRTPPHASPWADLSTVDGVANLDLPALGPEV
jgi:hypothetical protein